MATAYLQNLLKKGRDIGERQEIHIYIKTGETLCIMLNNCDSN